MTAKRIVDFVFDNICQILLVVGCAMGIVAFFVDWETFMVISTDGWAFAFGEHHDMWYSLIDNSCYIPIAILICSIASVSAFLYFHRRRTHMWDMMVFCTLCGVFMLLSMSALALTSFEIAGRVVFFANYIGLGTYLAWGASVLIMIGGGLYIASHGRCGDGQ